MSKNIEMPIDYKIIFNKKNIVRYIKLIIPAILILLVYELTVINKIYNNRITYIKNNLKEYYHQNKFNLDAVRKSGIILKAVYIEYGNNIYKYKDNHYIKLNKPILIKTIPTTDITYNIETCIYVNYKNVKIIYIINDRDQLFYLYSTLLNNVLVLLIMLSIMFIYYTYSNEKTNQIEKRSYELELEGKLQRTLTESAHHEMLMPLAVIKTLFLDFILKLYPCQKDVNQICSLMLGGDKSNKCQNCIVSKFNREIDLVAKEYFSRINLAIEQLESVLNQMAATKHVKYSNGNISLFNLLNNAINTINSSSVNKLRLELREKDKLLLSKYAIKAPLNNGNILNILNNHITNSKDAKATVIKIKTYYDSIYNTVSIYIGDNGIGIRDKYNRIIKVTDLFANGYSTKDKNGKSIVIDNTILNKVKDILFKVFNKNDNNSNSERGFGLYINKKILTKAGGDVELVDTSSKGTVFKLTLPVKLRKD